MQPQQFLPNSISHRYFMDFQTWMIYCSGQGGGMICPIPSRREQSLWKEALKRPNPPKAQPAGIYCSVNRSLTDVKIDRTHSEKSLAEITVLLLSCSCIWPRSNGPPKQGEALRHCVKVLESTTFTVLYCISLICIHCIVKQYMSKKRLQFR